MMCSGVSGGTRHTASLCNPVMIMSAPSSHWWEYERDKHLLGQNTQSHTVKTIELRTRTIHETNKHLDAMGLLGNLPIRLYKWPLKIPAF